MALHLKSTGIDFTDFSDATESSELLDDYEEGTFTFYSENGGVSSYTNQTASYTKIGRLVYISFYSGGWTCSSSVSATITGLPFNVANEAPAYSTAATTHDTWNTNSSSGYFSKNNNSIYFLQRDTTTASATPSSGSQYVMVSGCYYVA